MSMLAGRIAKHLTCEPRSKWIWNSFFGTIIIVVIVAVSCFMYQTYSDYITYDVEQIFIDYQNNVLFTDKDTFEIPEEKNQDIQITKLLETVSTGDVIRLSISKTSKDIIEIRFQNQIVYKKAGVPIVPMIVASIVLLFPVVAICVFMLFVFNVKNPRGKIRKIRDKYVKNS